MSAVLLAVAAALPASGRAADPPATRPTEAVWLQSNLAELYPSPAEVCLSTYRQMKDAPGVVVVLHTELEHFSHYRYTVRRDSLPAEAATTNRSGEIPVRFDDRTPRPQRIEVVIQAVSMLGRRTRPFSIELGYYPKELYAAAGQKSRSWLVVHRSDLALCGSSVEDWIVESPSSQDRDYARR